MTTKQVIEEVRRIITKHKGGEKELLDALTDEAEGWRMRLEELEAEEESCS